MKDLVNNISKGKNLEVNLPKFGQEGELPTIPGTVPPAGKFPAGCVFAPRCPHATEQCKAKKPPLVTTGEGHKVRCFRYTEDQEG